MVCWAPRIGPPRIPWATKAPSAIGISFITISGLNAATPNTAPPARRSPIAWVTDPPGSSATTSGAGIDVTSPPEPTPSRAAAPTANATAITSFEMINAPSSCNSFLLTPCIAGHTMVANTNGANATTT